MAVLGGRSILTAGGHCPFDPGNLFIRNPKVLSKQLSLTLTLYLISSRVGLELVLEWNITLQVPGLGYCMLPSCRELHLERDLARDLGPILLGAHGFNDLVKQ